MTLENSNWGNGVMLKSTLAKMAANVLDKALKPFIDQIDLLVIFIKWFRFQLGR